MGKITKHYFFIAILFVAIFGLTEKSEAAIYYAAPKGSLEADNTASGSGTLEDPWSIRAAMSNAQPGDTIHFRGGTYQAGQSVYNVNNSFYFPARSGTAENPIVFRAYEGETPVINGNVRTYVTGIAGEGTTTSQLVDTTKDFTSFGMSSGNSSSNVRTRDTANGGSWISSISANTITLNAPNTVHNTLTNFGPGDWYEIGHDSTNVLGNSGNDASLKSYITFDGFTIQANNGTELGAVYMEGPDNPPYSTGNVIRNCTFIGPSVKQIVHGDNKQFIFIQNNDNLTIENCSFMRLYQRANWHNTSGIKTYANTDIYVRNCEFSNMTLPIYFKSATDGILIENNFIHDCYKAIDVSSNMGSHTNVEIRHNILARCSNQTLSVYTEVDSRNTMDNYNIHHNTFYNSVSADGGLLGITIPAVKYATGYRIHNNVFQSPLKTGGFQETINLQVYGVSYQIDLIDYNAYGYPMKIGTRKTDESFPHYDSTMTSWRERTSPDINLTGGAHDLNSVGDFPVLFINSNGTMSESSDFALATDSPGYRAGSDGKDMGADISLVGVNPENMPPQDTTPPNTPTGLAVS